MSDRMHVSFYGMLGTHEFVVILVRGQVHCTKAASPDFRLDMVLIDAVNCTSVTIVAAAVMRPRVERLFHGLRSRRSSLVVPYGTLICRRGPVIIDLAEGPARHETLIALVHMLDGMRSLVVHTSRQVDTDAMAGLQMCRHLILGGRSRMILVPMTSWLRHSRCSSLLDHACTVCGRYGRQCREAVSSTEAESSGEVTQLGCINLLALGLELRGC